MKKVVFAIQIFSLMALLPAYMILELNRKNPAPQEYKTDPINRENSGGAGFRQFEGREAENTSGLFDFKSNPSF